MVQPLDREARVIRVLSGGSPALGLNTGSFTVNAWGSGYGASIFTAFADGTAVQSLGNGLYDVRFTLPAAAGWFFYEIVPTAPGLYCNTPCQWSGELESQDFQSLFANIVQPISTLTQSAQLGMPLAMSIVPYRYRQMVIPVKANGAAVDLTLYNNFRMSVRSKDQTTTKWDAANTSATLNALPGFSITGDNAGNLTVTLPESSCGPLYTSWAIAKAVAIGDFVVPTVQNGFIYQATVGGTTAGSAPAFPTTIGLTVTDNTVTWKCIARAIWMTGIATPVGTAIRPNAVASRQNQLWICTAAGATGVLNTGATEPVWPATPAAGATITDNGITWTYQSDFYAAIGPAITAGQTQASLFYEIVADILDTSKTIPIILSSPLTEMRNEYGT